MNHRIQIASLLAAIAGLASVSLRADPVTVQEVGVGASETVWINSSTLGNNLHVYAGVLDLKVNGVATAGFCIDPWHWSGTGPMAYNTETLGLAPKAPGPMGTTAATEIEQLWAKFYTPSISNVNAAALQLEIWSIVDSGVVGGTYSLLSIDGGSTVANAVKAEMTAMSSFLQQNPNAPTANLIALTGPGQDYVVQKTPDGGTTLGLLGLALVALVGFRKKFRRD